MNSSPGGGALPTPSASPQPRRRNQEYALHSPAAAFDSPGLMETNGDKTGGAPAYEPNSATAPASSSKARSPTHPGLISVEMGTGDFSARAISLVSLPPGAVFAKIVGGTAAARAYTSVQTGRTTDIELNSDLVYCNHSCAPSVVFDVANMEVRVVEGRALSAGEAVTFFYPSTEWDMQQPFECGCGAGEGVCLGTVRGSKVLEKSLLERYWLSEHVRELLAEREGLV